MAFQVTEVQKALEGVAATDAYRRRLRGFWERVDLFIAPTRHLHDQVVAGGPDRPASSTPAAWSREGP